MSKMDNLNELISKKICEYSNHITKSREPASNTAEIEKSIMVNYRLIH